MARISTPGHAEKFSISEITELLELLNDADQHGNTNARAKLKSILKQALKSTQQDIRDIEKELRNIKG